MVSNLHRVGQAVPVRLERPQDEGAKAVQLVLKVADLASSDT